MDAATPQSEASAASAASDPHAKALSLNLDTSIYGTFAEIGAGQEVANWFLRVGAASGTVAQTICAYDKNFSDERYGKGTRYVSRERLLAMLDCEFASLTKQLGENRRAGTRFFTFADTVAAKNFKGDHEQHGWVGLRFEAEQGQPTNEVLLHVGLRDDTADQQQEALGILGVNLIFAAYHQASSAESPSSRVSSRGSPSSDSRRRHRAERTALRVGVDSRLWCLQALRRDMCHAVVFDGTGRPVGTADRRLRETACCSSNGGASKSSRLTRKRCCVPPPSSCAARTATASQSPSWR